MDAAYEDKLDGTIGEETWRRKSDEWRSRQLEMQAAIERHLQASQVYYEAGVKLLRLAQNAYTLWLTRPQTEKRKLLNLPQSNCTFDGVSLTPCYEKPFCCAIRRIAGQKGLCVAYGGADGARTRDFHLDRVAL